MRLRVAELAGEQQFSEGEPDLEPPEELAIGEIDDDAILEEGLDNDDVSEEDVDDELLAWTLEDLVHVDDDRENGTSDQRAAGGPPILVLGTGEDGDGDEDEDDAVGALEVEDLEDLEESLDLLLALLVAAPGPDEDAEDGLDGWSGAQARPGGRDGTTLACGPQEFVCRSCFLVHHRAQLAGGPARICRDCAG